MTFQIHPLDPAPFAPLFALGDAELAAKHARRVTATSNPGFPCRVSLADAAVGETLILVNHQHLPGDTPFRASHAVFIREGAQPAQPAPGELPEALRRRLLSLRAFDAQSMMIDADVAEGEAAGARLAAWFARPDTAFVHLHTARQGCFLAAAVPA